MCPLAGPGTHAVRRHEQEIQRRQVMPIVEPQRCNRAGGDLPKPSLKRGLCSHQIGSESLARP
jgi:hypothetical protein